MSRPRVPGRLLAWTALAVALLASVAANVAFARPAPGPRMSAGVAPVLVVLAAGLLERVPLAGVRWWRRWTAYGGLSTVVLAAFVTSFEHQYALLLSYGNTALSATLLPVAVDGLIVLASVCLTVIADRARALAVPVRPAGPVPVPPAEPVPATPRAPRTARRTDDAVLLAVLSEIPREPDGTVPVRRAATALGTGPDRARRLLRQARLYRESATTVGG